METNMQMFEVQILKLETRTPENAAGPLTL